MCRLLPIFLLLIGFSPNLFSQLSEHEEVTELIQRWQNCTDETCKANTLIKLGQHLLQRESSTKQLDSADRLARQAAKSAERLRDKQLQLQCKILIGALILKREGWQEGYKFIDYLDVLSDELNAGKTHATRIEDTARVVSRLAVAMYYLRLPGEEVNDMDSTLSYIHAATSICTKKNLSPLWFVCEMVNANYLLEKKEFARAKYILVDVASRCQALNNTKRQAEAFELIGKYLPYQDAYYDNKALFLGRASRLYCKIGQTTKGLEMARYQADVHIEQHKFDLAEKELTALIPEHQRTKNPEIYGCYSELSTLQQERGNYNKAIYWLQKAVEHSEGQTGLQVLDVYFDMASLYYSLEKDSLGLVWQMKEYDYMTKRYGNLFHWHFCQLILAMIRLGRVSEAFRMSKGFYAFKENVITSGPLVDFCMASCYDALGQRDPAEKCYQQTMKRQVDPFFQPMLSIGIGQFYLKTNQPVKTKYYINRLLKIPGVRASAIESRNLQYISYKTDSALGHYLPALAHFARYKALNDSIFSYKKMQEEEELQVKYETEKKERTLLQQSQSITALTKEGVLKESRLVREKATRNLAVAISGLTIVIAILIFLQYRNNQTKNKRLQSLIGEKDHLIKDREWLLRELHHRVKNNLHMIISLLESHSAYLKGDALTAVQESKDRINSMSLIHQKLMQSDLNFGTVDMASYTMDLVTCLRQSFGNTKAVSFVLELQPLALDVSQAIPIGLILNEAITNAIKYAVPRDAKEAKITVSMSTDDSERVHLEVADNGPGMPENFNIENCRSLGVKLMNGLSEDINGKFLISSKQGTIVSVTFQQNPFPTKVA